MGTGKYKIGARVRDDEGDEGVIVEKRKGERLVEYDGQTGSRAWLNGTKLWSPKRELTVLPVNDNTPADKGGFKVGDRVKCVDSTEPCFGMLGVISVSERGGTDLDVCFDDWTGGHSGDANDGSSSHWYLLNKDVELIPASPEWQPKVGDRVRRLNYAHAGLEVGDIGIIARIDETTIVLEGGESGWAHQIYNLELAPLTIEAGKFYRTRDGRKVGPVVESGGSWPFRGEIEGKSAAAFQADGKCPFFPDYDLVAEWVDEPTAKPAEPVAVAPAIATPAEPEPKFKVGDRVRSVSDVSTDIKIGGVYTITRVSGDMIEFLDEGGDSRSRSASEYELVSQPSLIVCKLTNGKPRPSNRPHVHDTRQAATAEAARLTGIYGGEFAVYERV